jgi:hypothetical protein
VYSTTARQKHLLPTVMQRPPSRGRPRVVAVCSSTSPNLNLPHLCKAAAFSRPACRCSVDATPADGMPEPAGKCKTCYSFA